MSGLKAITFKEGNRILNRPADMTEEECGALLVFTDGDQCISCWAMSFRQRLKVLFFGRIWLGVLSGNTQPPVWLSCERTPFRPKQE